MTRINIRNFGLAQFMAVMLTLLFCSPTSGANADVGIF
jgi:hypothetical protein